MSRDMKAARAKVDAEGECRVCGRPDTLEAAHIVSRAQVQPGIGESVGNIVPLCKQHHSSYDQGSLDLLPFLTGTEQATAVMLHPGHLMGAFRRITNSRDPGGLDA